MFHGGHQLQKVVFQLEIHNTIPPDSIGQPKTNYLVLDTKINIVQFCKMLFDLSARKPSVWIVPKSWLLADCNS